MSDTLTIVKLAPDTSNGPKFIGESSSDGVTMFLLGARQIDDTAGLKIIELAAQGQGQTTFWPHGYPGVDMQFPATQPMALYLTDKALWPAFA